MIIGTEIPKLINPDESLCEGSLHFRLLAWILFLTCLLCAYLEFRISRIALKGAILEVSARLRAEKLAKPLLIAMTFQFSTNILATYWAVKQVMHFFPLFSKYLYYLNAHLSPLILHLTTNHSTSKF